MKFALRVARVSMVSELGSNLTYSYCLYVGIVIVVIKSKFVNVVFDT